MVELPIGIMMALSLVPYVVEKKHSVHGHHLTIMAVNWSLRMTWHDGKCDWTFRLPVYECARTLLGARTDGGVYRTTAIDKGNPLLLTSHHQKAHRKGKKQSCSNR